MNLSEVREKIAEIDARIKAEKKLRCKWTAYERCLTLDEAMAQIRKGEDDE